jgi:hypothetical protein
MKHRLLLTSIKKANDNNWNAHLHSADGITDFPLSQFHVYSHYHDNTFISCLSIDKFLENVVTMKDTPNYLCDPSAIAAALSDSYLSLREFDTQDTHADLANLLQFYMINTQTGQQYFNQFVGRPFSFIVALYPDNNKGTKFFVRPMLLGNAELMTMDEVKKTCLEVAKADKANGKKEYFRYLPKL